jgi:hypothetical protein
MIKSKQKRAPVSGARKPKDGYFGVSSLALKRGTNKFSQSSNLNRHTQRVVGTELIGRVRLNAAPESGQVVFSKKNAANPLGTRLERIAPLYKRWRVHRYTYRFIPTLPTTTAGSFVIAQDPDPLASYSPIDDSNINRLMTLEGAEMRQVWQASECRLSPFGDYTSLWTADLAPTVDDPSDRLCYAGQFLLVLSSAGTLTSTSDLGYIELDYDIEFFSPNLSTQSIDDNVPWTNYLYSVWQTFTSTKQSDSFNGYFSDLLNSSYLSSEAVGTLFKVLRDVLMWAAPAPMICGPSAGPYTSEPQGVPRGAYMMQIFMGSLLSVAGASVIFAAESPNSPDAYWFAGQGTSERKSITAGNTTGPDGTIFTWSVSWFGSFIVNSERGFPALYVTNGATPPHADTRFYMRLSAHDQGFLFAPGAPGTALFKRVLAPPRELPHRSERLESKDSLRESHFSIPSSIAIPSGKTRVSDVGCDVINNFVSASSSSGTELTPVSLRRR